MGTGGIEILRVKRLPGYSHFTVKQIERRAYFFVLAPNERAFGHEAAAHKRADIIVVIAKASLPQVGKFADIFF